MSGYLELKHPRSQIGLNPFKSWKKQWCILRPCPTRAGGAALAMYSSESGNPAGCIEIPPGSKIFKAKSRSRAHAFAIYAADEPQKARVLLAGHSLQDTQMWIDKINSLLQSNKKAGSDLSLMDLHYISISSTELSKKCGFKEIDGVLALTSQGVLLAEQAPKEHKVVIPWRNVSDVVTDRNKFYFITIDGGFTKGPGVIKFTTPSTHLSKILKQTLRQMRKRESLIKISKSDSDLRFSGSFCDDNISSDLRRDSWRSETSALSIGETNDVPQTLLSDSGCYGDQNASKNLVNNCITTLNFKTLNSLDRSARRSVISIASGIYEEIPDIPTHSKLPKLPIDVATNEFQHSPTEGADIKLKANGLRLKKSEDNSLYDKVTRLPIVAATNKFQDLPTDGANIDLKENGSKLNKSEDNLLNDSKLLREEPTYESVSECVFATMRRSGRRFPPPPLPPRMPLSLTKLNDWQNTKTENEVTLHSSLGCLPQCHNSSTTDLKTKTLPKYDKSKNTFNVFRKRLKSDSTIHIPTRYEAKEKDLDTKKKRFEFTPKRDIFKSFKTKKNKAGKTTNLNKSEETKSCEFLDDSKHHVTSNRCSKSVDNLDDDDFEDELSIDCGDDVPASLSLPPDIIELFLKSQERSVGVKREIIGEDDYMPMSPIVLQQTEQHYTVMSPRSDLVIN